MSQNIKNEETQCRAKELARPAGETMTEAVDHAIAERLERIRKMRNKTALVERLLEIGHECAALPVLDRRRPEEMMYDKHGLPKQLSSTPPRWSRFWTRKPMRPDTRRPSRTPTLP